MTKRTNTLRFCEQPELPNVPQHRILRLEQLADAELRTATFEEREHLVVPVIAIMEGVIHACNADTPELVLAGEIAAAHQAWNGEPALSDHPTSETGARVSGNSPTVLEQYRMGRIFDARMQDKKLRVDAWLDTARCEELGGSALETLERIRAGEMVEVSIGAFVDAIPQEGIYKGQRYMAVWRAIVPDHLALLPAGTTGACSNEMGCGTRAAAGTEPGPLHRIGADGTIRPSAEGQAEEPSSMKGKTLREIFAGAIAFVFRGGQGMSDSDLREILHTALFETEPAFLGIEEVFPDESTVVYAVFRDDQVSWFSASYTIAEADENAVTFGEATEVRPETTTTFVPVEAAASCGCPDRAACECGTHQENDMNKAQRIAAFIASTANPYTAADQAALEAMSDETLKALEEGEETPAAPAETPAETPAAPAEETAAPAETPAETPAAPATPAEGQEEEDEEEPVSLEKYLATAPPEVKQMWAERQAALAERKAGLVALLAGGQKHYTEAQLQEQPLEKLEEIAALLGTEEKVEVTPAPDFTGIPMPRTLDRGREGVPAAPSLTDAVRTARGHTTTH